MKLHFLAYTIDMGAEFAARPLAEQQQLLKQIGLEWQSHVDRPTLFKRLQDDGRCVVLMYYVLFPVGLFFCLTCGGDLARLRNGLVCIAVPVVWLLAPAVIERFTLPQFYKKRAKQLLLERQTFSPAVFENRGGSQ